MTTSNNNGGGGGGGGGGTNRHGRAGSAGKLSPIPHFRIEEEQQFAESYVMGNKLGEGSFGVVYEVKERQTGERWACKLVNKDNTKEKGWGSKMKLLEREVDILKRVNHEHIIRLKEVFETPQKMYLVMSLCEGGELSKELKRRGQLTERETRIIMERLTSAISYLHKNDMVHRDLKLENILLSNNPNDSEDRLYIKVTDFGLSVVKGGVGHENMMMDFCGTPMYMAPEIIDNKTYSEKCDVWAMGVIMSALLTGGPPFSGYGSDDEELYAQIKNLDIHHHVNTSPAWAGISEEGKDCMTRVMTSDPAHRLTSSELLDQPWITETTLDPVPGPRNVLEMMKAWSNNLEDDAPSSSAINTNTNNRTVSAGSKKRGEASSRSGSRGGESSQEETSAPTSRNGSANSGKNAKTAGPKATPAATSVRTRTNSLPRNSISTSNRPPARKSPSDSGSSSSSNNTSSRPSGGRNPLAATGRTPAPRQSTKPTSTSTNRHSKVSTIDSNKTSKKLAR